MHTEDEPRSASELTDPYLYSIFAPAWSDAKGVSPSGGAPASSPTPGQPNRKSEFANRNSFECRRSEVRLLFLVGLFPDL